MEEALSQSAGRLRNFSVSYRSAEKVADGTQDTRVILASYEDLGGDPLLFHAAYMVTAASSTLYELQIETDWDDSEGFMLLIVSMLSFRAGVAPARPPYEARILALGFTPTGSSVSTGDGSGGSLVALRGICTGSATGRCQQVFFFHNGEYLGTDTLSPSSGIPDVQYAGVAKIAVTYVNYAPSDPGCCPSLAPVTITYSWDGTQLKASGVPPGH
jgi:hypothetical protein